MSQSVLLTTQFYFEWRLWTGGSLSILPKHLHSDVLGQMQVTVTVANYDVLKSLSNKPIVHTYPDFRRPDIKWRQVLCRLKEKEQNRIRRPAFLNNCMLNFKRHTMPFIETKCKLSAIKVVLQIRAIF
jgi:hypothetical protein